MYLDIPREGPARSGTAGHGVARTGVLPTHNFPDRSAIASVFFTCAG
jgi:hypothetical protein